MTAECKLDRERLERLATRLMEQITPELLRFPPAPENVFTVLNALAVAAGTVIAGAGDDARRFFEEAVANNIAIVKHAETGPPGPLGHA